MDLYERRAGRKDTRAGSWHRSPDTRAGEVSLQGPKLWRQTFEAAIIERYRRRESSVEVARRHDLRANPLSPWRRFAKDGKLVVPNSAGVEFAPVVLAPEAAPSVAAPVSAVEIVQGSVTIRLDAGPKADRCAEIALALSARG